MKYITAMSAQTATNFHDAETLQHEVSFILKKEKVLSFDDPQTEQWFSAIEGLVANNTDGLTKSERKEATRLTAGLTSLTTSLVRLKPNSEKCKDAILLKTLLIPKIEFNSSTSLAVKDDLLKEKYSSSNTHMLLSKD